VTLPVPYAMVDLLKAQPVSGCERRKTIPPPVQRSMAGQAGATVVETRPNPRRTGDG
jgi:hypothetical protein